MVKGVTAFLCAATLAGALAATPAHAGEPFAVKVAKHKDGPYKVDIRANIDPGETQSFWFRVANLGDEELSLVFGDAGESDGVGFRTRWFKHGDNVSTQVEGLEGYPFNLDPGQRKYFNAKQRALAAPAAQPGCLAGQASIPMVISDLSSVSINGETCTF